jgi:Raf kinase inhibitor-like YbhB/YbcL family protein
MVTATSLHFRSHDFRDGEPIPLVHTGLGDDQSPALAWDAVPAATRSLALVCEDIDAPSGSFIHWLLYDCPPTLRQLPAGLPADAQLAGIGRQGLNDFGRIGNNGPNPPPGSPHRYIFTLYALDARPDLEPAARHDDLLAAIDGHVLQDVDVVGVCERP